MDHVEDILGATPKGRVVRIMVTLPTESADEYQLIRDLVNAGMDIARINCAHDDEASWLRMIKNIDRAESEIGRHCKIFMDVAGAKLRTGELRPGPGALRIRPRRNSLGQVIAPRRIRFVEDGTQWSYRKSAIIPVPRECIDFVEIGDVIRFKDTRGKRRKFYGR